MSSRMGQDKGSMYFKEEPMILRVLKNINGHVDEALLILRDNTQLKEYKNILKDNYISDFFKFDLKFFIDEIKGQGPLGGIMVGLSHINSDHALVLPCDAPYVSGIFIDSIFSEFESENQKYDAVVPMWENKNLEPLHSIYSTKTKETIEQMILHDQRDVKSFIKQINSRFVSAESLDPSKMSFNNFNRPEDIL